MKEAASSKQRSFFVTFEGGEGVGKSTLVEGLYRILSSKGFEVLKTQEPGSTPLGKKIREILLQDKKELNLKAELFLFLADRAQHIEEVLLPALQRGLIVLCDRYTDSTLAYQGISLPQETLEQFSFFATGGLKPDLTFMLDLDPQWGRERLQKSENFSSLDRLEKKPLVFHEKVRKIFLQIASKERSRVVLLDASASAQDLLVRALTYFEKRYVSNL